MRYGTGVHSMFTLLLRTVLAVSALTPEPIAQEFRNATDRVSLDYFSSKDYKSVSRKENSRFFSLRDLCRSGWREKIYVRDSVTLYFHNEDRDEEKDEKSYNSSGEFYNELVSSGRKNRSGSVSRKLLRKPCEIMFLPSPQGGVLFLAVLKNDLPVNRDRCAAWYPFLHLRTPKQRMNLGCVRSANTFFEPPLVLRWNLMILEQLLNEPPAEKFLLTVSAVSFDCSKWSETERLAAHEESEGDVYSSRSWWPCTAHEKFCIRKNLFCDGVNNCGAWEDETRCEANENYADALHSKNASLNAYANARKLFLAGKPQSMHPGQKLASRFAAQNYAQHDFAREKRMSDNGSSNASYVPAVTGFFAFLAVTALVCFTYLWWTKYRNRRLQHNFIDYVIKYRRRAQSGPDCQRGSIPFGEYATSNFLATTDEQTAIEWTAEHRSLLGRRR